MKKIKSTNRKMERAKIGAARVILPAATMLAGAINADAACGGVVAYRCSGHWVSCPGNATSCTIPPDDCLDLKCC